MYKAIVSFNKVDFEIFIGGSISTPLSEKEGALLSSALSFLLIRQAWQEMTDSEWDSFSSELAELAERIMP